MNKVSLSVSELLQLQTEVIGNENFKGIVSLKMPMLTKFKLSKIVNIIKSELEAYYVVNNELVKKYGEPKGDDHFISNVIEVEENGEKKSIPNPNMKKYFDEISPVLEQTKEYDLPEFTIEDFKDCESDNYYNIFFTKIIKEGNE